MAKNMDVPPTNMIRFPPSRRQRKAGDYFFSVRPDEYYWGRIISRDGIVGGWKKATLVYLYDACSSSMEDRPLLSKENLLVPPISPLRSLWSRGYFCKVNNEPLKPDDVLSKHCFFGRFTGKFRDGFGGYLSEKSEPCGSDSNYSEIGIDGEISKALGLPDLDYFDRGNSPLYTGPLAAKLALVNRLRDQNR